MNKATQMPSMQANVAMSLRLSAVLSAGLILTACAAPPPRLPGTLTGVVTYRERMALPPNAVVEVQLQDVSRADAPAQTIAEQVITPTTQVPIPFELKYDPASIDPRNRYAVAARITADDELLFINTTAYPVITGGNPTANVEVVVEQTGGAQPAQVPNAVTGVVTYRQRGALPLGATVEVKLLDASKQDAGAVTVGQQIITPTTQVPIPFEVEFDPAAIDPRNRYVLYVTISEGDQLLYTTTSAYNVLTQGYPSSDIEVVVEPVSNALAGSTAITGTVTYLQRIALPPNAIVEVALVDASRQDAPATVIAQQTITPTTQVPIPFEVAYDPATINVSGTYALVARISVDGAPRFATTQPYNVLTNGNPTTNVELILEPVSEAKPAQPPAAITGTVTYRERIELPPNAVVDVQLQDVSKADAPATVIAQQTITPTTQVPIPFELTYDPNAIEPNGRYAIRAAIKVDDQLMFATTSAYPVLTNGAPTTGVEVVVERVG